MKKRSLYSLDYYIYLIRGGNTPFHFSKNQMERNWTNNNFPFTFLGVH